MVTDGGVNAVQCIDIGCAVNSGDEYSWPRNYQEALACQQALQNKVDALVKSPFEQNRT
jgi:hypothetical protein